MIDCKYFWVGIFLINNSSWYFFKSIIYHVITKRVLINININSTILQFSFAEEAALRYQGRLASTLIIWILGCKVHVGTADSSTDSVDGWWSVGSVCPQLVALNFSKSPQMLIFHFLHSDYSRHCANLAIFKGDLRTSLHLVLCSSGIIFQWQCAGWHVLFQQFSVRPANNMVCPTEPTE